MRARGRERDTERVSVRERAIKRARSLIILATFSGPASFVVAAAALCVRSCEFSLLLLRCVVRSFVVGAWLTHFFSPTLTSTATATPRVRCLLCVRSVASRRVGPMCVCVVVVAAHTLFVRVVDLSSEAATTATTTTTGRTDAGSMNFFAFVSHFVPRLVVAVVVVVTVSSIDSRIFVVAVFFFIVGEIRQRRKSNYSNRGRGRKAE